MLGRYLLGTDIVIALFANDAAARDNLAQAEEVFVPSIVIGELYYGAQKSERAAEYLLRVDEFAARSVVLGCDTETAQHYGETKNTLHLKGCSIAENNIWIAAIAMQHGLVLVTRDVNFDEIDGLNIVHW
jgi:tRNA(fMet)-specific endonuclease VapC